MSASAVFADVATSNHPLALIASAIAPEGFAVTSVVDKNRGLHHGNLRPSQLVVLEQAELVVWLGKEAEPGLERVIQRVNGGKVLDLAGLFEEAAHQQAVVVDQPEIHQDDHQGTHHHAVDMHIWLNPAEAIVLAGKIGEQLIALWPQKAAQVSSNLQRFGRQMLQISSESQQKSQNMKVLALHDAYGHLAEYYGFTVLASIVDASGNKPGAKQLHQVQQLLEQQQASCVLTQPQFSGRYLSALPEVAALPQLEVDPNATRYDLERDGFVLYSKAVAATLQRCAAKS